MGREILEIKQIPDQKDLTPIGEHPLGGLVSIGEKLYWLRHPKFRWNGSSFGWENDGFSKADLSEVGFCPEIPALEVSKKLVRENLKLLREGSIPSDFTTGIEVEGSLYDKKGNLISKHDGELVKIEEDAHPELLHFTVETATRLINGDYLRHPVDIARATAEAVLQGYKIAEVRNGFLVYSSVAEGGLFDQAKITPHPYLLSFAPMVLDFTLENWERIPQLVKDIYFQLGVDIYQYLNDQRILNWPVNALHVHSGIPQIEGLADPRIAFAYGMVRRTELAKLFNFLLYNTNYLYGIDTKLKDVRSVVRRLLATTIDDGLYSNSKELLEGMIEEMTVGKIHSPSRFPATGQHDRVRFRAEAKYKTVESIEAPMTPDLRLVLGWVFFNQILNVIALDAMENTEGDESRVLEYLQQRWGDIFTLLPTLGSYSSFSFDLVFNQNGFDEKIGGKTIREKINDLRGIIRFYANEYSAIRTQVEIVDFLISQGLSEQNFDLEGYLGIKNGLYIPDRKNKGLITESKRGRDVLEIIEVQHRGTLLQAQALLEIRDENDLKDFFGL